VMIVTGRLRPSSADWIHEDAGAVDLTPWKLARPFGALLLLTVITVYAAFA
jgi:SSS family solute:Na+ symporter